MNLLTEKPTNEIAGYKIKTDFQTWVKLLIALKSKDREHIFNCYMAVFDEDIEDVSEAVKSAPKVIEWIRLHEPKESDTEGEGSYKQPYDYAFDCDVIFSELWRFFPLKMQQGLEYHEAVTFIQYLCAMPHEQSQLSKRVFARCGDFSTMGKEQQRYWQEMKAKFRIPLSEDEQEEINTIAEILKGDGDLSKLEVNK